MSKRLKENIGTKTSTDSDEKRKTECLKVLQAEQQKLSISRKTAG
jgi:hypothetical protein